MTVKEPTVQVPVTTLLELIRLYKENPQEVLNRVHWLVANRLERIAYRKYLDYKKRLKGDPV